MSLQQPCCFPGGSGAPGHQGESPVWGGRAKSSIVRDSVRRITAMVVAIGFHLALLALLMRPAAHQQGAMSSEESDVLSLKLRFIPPWPTFIPPASQTRRQVTPAPEMHRKLSGSAQPTPAQGVARVIAAPQETPAHSRITIVIPTTPYQYPNNDASASDADFQKRLLDAKHSHDVHGIPGSDRRVVEGIQLADPMHQGIGSVMRSTQRLFGITNHNCMDTDTLGHLTREELSARHTSPEDLKKVDDKYECNKPLGLSF